MATPLPDLTDTDFWNSPLEDRMAGFAAIRQSDPFARYEFANPLTGELEEFFAVTRHADVMEISRNAADFCSGQGSISIVDMPAEVSEFFGSFINMDDPRHARQRGIVARSFTPRQLQGVLDSVESICTEVIDDMCEKGEVDLVSAISQPFPLLVICDMMGIPRSEYTTVLDATNVILGGGDPEFLDGKDFISALFEAGITLKALMNDLAAERRANPTEDLTSKLVNTEHGDDVLTADELGSFFILLAVAGNDTTRTATTLGMHLLGQNPEQRSAWQADIAGATTTAVEEIVRMASPVTFMRRTVTRPLTLSGQEFNAGDRLIMFYGAANRDPSVFENPDKFDIRRDPNPHLGFGGPGPHFCLGAHLTRRELAVVFRQILTRLPDIELAGPPEFLESVGPPLVGGVKRLPVRFTPTARIGSR